VYILKKISYYTFFYETKQTFVCPRITWHYSDCIVFHLGKAERLAEVKVAVVETAGGPGDAVVTTGDTAMLGPGDAAMVGLGRVSVFWALSR
jgi:hypothetical protein